VKLTNTWKKSPYIASSKKGVALGMIETSTYYLMEEMFSM
jgi:hypothetical protein